MDHTEEIKIAGDPESQSERLETLFGLSDDVDRLLAGHLNATENLLERLSLSRDQITCRNVVLNANTSKNVLLVLAPRFPMDFFRNPTFDWWLLEEPDLLLRVGKGVLKNILKRSECPEAFMKWAAKKGSEEERLAVATNSNAPVDVLREIIKTGGPVGILTEAVLLDKPDRLSRLRKRRFAGLDHEPGMLDDILKRPECPVMLMKWAVDKGRDEEKLSLAMNPNAPVDLLELMAKTGGVVADAVKSHRKLHISGPPADPNVVFEDAVKKAVFELPSHEAKESWGRGWIGPGQWVWLAPSSRLRVLGLEDVILLESEWRSTYSQMLLGSTRLGTTAKRLPPNDLPIDHVRKVTITKDLDTRLALARSTLTPIAALTRLAKDKNVQVLCNLAGNPSMPANLLEAMAKSTSRTVREAVASTPLTSKSSLETLAKDDDFEVRKRAAVSLSSPELFVRICSEFAVSKLILLAEKYRTSSWVIIKLDEMQKTGSINEFLVQEANRLLLEPQTSFVAKIIGATNPAVHLHSRHDAVWAGAHYVDNLAARLLGLCHPGASPGALIGNFKSTEWLDRLAIACNPSCPPNLLAILKRDGHEMVAKMARAVDMAKSVQREEKQETLPNNSSNLPKGEANLSTPCPKCAGVVKEGVESFECIGVNGKASCGFKFNKAYAERPFSVAEAELLMRERKVGPLPGFRSKTGSYFTSGMIMKFDEKNNAYKVVFDFGKDKKVEGAASQADFADRQSLGFCPKCAGAVFELGSNYICINSVASPTNPKPSCSFKTGRNVLQQVISPEQVSKLLSTGRTDLLDEFVSSRTQKRFTAMLVWDVQAGKVNFEFPSAKNW